MRRASHNLLKKARYISSNSTVPASVCILNYLNLSFLLSPKTKNRGDDDAKGRLTLLEHNLCIVIAARSQTLLKKSLENGQKSSIDCQSTCLCLLKVTMRRIWSSVLAHEDLSCFSNLLFTVFRSLESLAYPFWIQRVDLALSPALLPTQLHHHVNCRTLGV